jgi:hypothetical protein
LTEKLTREVSRCPSAAHSVVLGSSVVFSRVFSISTWDTEGPGNWIRSLLSIVEEVNGAGDKVSGGTTMVKAQIILEALGLVSSKAELSGPLKYQLL